MLQRKEKRVKERYQCLMPVSLSLKDGVEGARIAGPAKGVFSNISAHGAALLVDELRFGDFHLVESPLENQEFVLEMEVGGMPILCRPVWFHPARYGGEDKFRVGVSFLRPPTKEELNEMTALGGREESEESGGWKGIVRKIFSS